MTTAADLFDERQPPPSAPPTRWLRNLVFGILGFTIVLGWVGDAFWASLVDRSPVALIALNAKPRYLILTVNTIDPWVFYPLATFRLLVTKPLVWLVGSWYGPRAMHWAERRSERGGRVFRWMELHFGRFGWFIIAVTSNNVVCLMAGAAGFSLFWFMVLAVAGTLVRLWLLAQVGSALADPISAFIDLVVDNRALIVALSVAVVLGGLLWQRRRTGSELDELVAFEHAMDDAVPAAEPTDPEPGP